MTAGSAATGNVRTFAHFLFLARCSRKEILPLELVDSRFYHLDTCFCPLSGGDLLYFPAAFDRYAQAAIADRIRHCRGWPVPEQEALKLPAMLSAWESTSFCRTVVRRR